MPNHQAAEQCIGYLYQVRYALSLLLDNDNPNFQICLEKFDDISFSDNESPKELIQLKHHVNTHGNLTDSSNDLWRTLKVWIDLISDSPDLLDQTDFLLVTTSVAPDNSAAFFLKKDSNRNERYAFDTLKNVSLHSISETNKKFYDAFNKTDVNIIKHLLSKICIIDGASNIQDVESDIKKHVRYSCNFKYQNQVLERLEGWWFRKSIEILCSPNPIFVSQNQARTFIVSLSQEYSDDNLPIEFEDFNDIDESVLSNSDKIFYEQLKLICLSSYHMQLALRDYYRAFRQRASWVRNRLLFIDELEKYEQRLIDEWQHAFANMEDNLTGQVSEQDKIKEGRALLSNIENKDIRIRAKCQEAFVMRGSYHMLANQLAVGWHIDFYERLKHMLNT